MKKKNFYAKELMSKKYKPKVVKPKKVKGSLTINFESLDALQGVLERIKK